MIPPNFITINGYEYDKGGVDLQSWVSNQKSRYNSLTVGQKKMLEEIGFVQNFRETKWQEMYNLAKTYYNYYNNLHINRNFKTVNGYEYDESGVELGKWIFLQKD